MSPLFIVRVRASNEAFIVAHPGSKEEVAKHVVEYMNSTGFVFLTDGQGPATDLVDVRALDDVVTGPRMRVARVPTLKEWEAYFKK